MNNSDEMLLEKGRIITVTASIENQMSSLGAVGTGLREKTDSLKNRLSAAAIRNSGYIGMLRNRVAHEPEAVLTDVEITNFSDAAEALLDELEKLSTPAKPDVPGNVPPPAAVPTPEFVPADDDSVEMTAPPPEKRHRRHRNWLEKLAFLPGIHLVFGVVLIFRSLRKAAGYLILAAAEAVALWLIVVGFRENNRPLVIAAAVTEAVGWLGGVVDRQIRNREMPFALAALPGAHIIYACGCAVVRIAPVELFGAAAIGVSTWVAIMFWRTGERELALFFLAAGCLAAHVASKHR